MEANEIEPGPRHEGGQGLHEFERRQAEVGGVVLLGALELQYDLGVAVDFEWIIGNRGVGDRAAELLEFMALIHGAAPVSMDLQ